jgi:DNA polymerase III sliding clamp (beta) subunit (PCNA family)
MNRVELVKTLGLLKPALAANNMVPIFQCFAFEDGIVSAYDDNIAIVGPCEVDVGGSVAIHGNTLLGLLSSSTVEEVTFEQKGDVVIVTMAKSVSKLPFQPEENFIFKVPDDQWKYKIPVTESVIMGIQLCLETTSKDTTQAALLGVTIEGDRLYGCDSDALTRFTLKNAIKSRILMSNRFCEAVLKLWAATSKVKGTLHFSDDWVFADFDDWSIYGRLLEVKDPIDFEALIKKNIKGKTDTYLIPSGFTGALSRARVLADPESQKTVVTVAKGKLTLRTETHMGEVVDTLAMKDHPDVSSNVNAAHLQRGLEVCEKISFLDTCTILERAPQVFQIVSNMA